MNDSSGFTKRAMKGTSKSSPIIHQDFIDSLYSGTLKQTDERNLKFQNKLKHMTVQSVKKHALNNIYTKMTVLDNGVTVEPLSKNGEYI